MDVLMRVNLVFVLEGVGFFIVFVFINVVFDVLGVDLLMISDEVLIEIFLYYVLGVEVILG